MAKVLTIGVYGFTAESFLERLAGAGVQLLIDVRGRRGVRGSEYAWANARRLETALAGRGIGYAHHRELVMPRALRERQYEADARSGVGQRSRVTLDPEVADAYRRQVLDQADLKAVAAEIAAAGGAALLCVERDPAACHRSLIAARLAEEHGFSVQHLLPNGAQGG